MNSFPLCFAYLAAATTPCQMYRYRNCRWLCFCCQRRELRYRDQYRVRVARAPPPSTILWENFGLHWIERLARNVRTASLFPLLISSPSALLVFTLPPCVPLPPPATFYVDFWSAAGGKCVDAAVSAVIHLRPR